MKRQKGETRSLTNLETTQNELRGNDLGTEGERVIRVLPNSSQGPVEAGIGIGLGVLPQSSAVQK